MYNNQVSEILKSVSETEKQHPQIKKETHKYRPCSLGQHQDDSKKVFFAKLSKNN